MSCPYTTVPNTIYLVPIIQSCALWKIAYPLIFQFHFKAVLLLFGHPVLAYLGSYVELMHIIPVPDNSGSTGIFLLYPLAHNHWSHYQALFMATNPTLIYMLTFYL